MEGLAELRRSKGFSQRTLAEAAGVSPSTIYELERGTHAAHPSTAKKLADAMGVEVADVLEALEAPKVPAPPSQVAELTFNHLLEEERRTPTLRPQITLVTRLADKWDQEVERLDSQAESHTGLEKNVRRVMRMQWAREIFEVYVELLKTFAEDSDLGELVYDADEVRELYAALSRMDEVVERTHPWFARDAEAGNVIELDQARAALRSELKRNIGA